MNTISWLMGSLAVYNESIYLVGIMVALNIGLAIAIFNFHIASNEKVKKVSDASKDHIVYYAHYFL